MNIEISLRDYFAAAVLQGQSAIPDERTCPKDRLNDVDAWRKEIYKNDARFAYIMADMMLDVQKETI